MTSKLDEAVTVIKSLPAKAQDNIAEEMIQKARLHRQLNEELAEAEARLDAGEGIPAAKLIASLRRQQRQYGV